MRLTGAEKSRRWRARHPERARASSKKSNQKARKVVDHIIPLSKGGAHSPENLQIIYAKENSVKGARLDYIPKVVFT